MGFKSLGPARDRVMWMVSLGIVENTEEKRLTGKRGRPGAIYAYIPIPVTQTARRRETPPELEVVKKVSRAGTVSGTGATMRSNSKSKNKLLRKARRQGFRVKRANNGHIQVTTPDGRRYKTASTPKADGVANDERKLRELGMVA